MRCVPLMSPLISLLLYVPWLRQVSLRWMEDHREKQGEQRLFSLSVIPVGWYQNRSKLFQSSNQDGSRKKTNVCKQLENLIPRLLYPHCHSNLRAVERIQNLKPR